MSVPEGTPPSLSDAANATRAMIDTANAEPVPTTPTEYNTTTETPQVDPGATDVTSDTPTPLAWDQIDLSVLPEDARKVVQEGYLRQSDYTRKTQELAEQRKQFEALGDFETAQAAVEFARSLEDPANLIELKSDIEKYLAEMQGTNLTEPATETRTPGLDPATQSRIDAMEARFAAMEHQAQEAELVEQLQEKFQLQEDAIRKDYPYYEQKHIDKIYENSETTNWDLFEAREKFERDRDFWTQELIGNKERFPDAANSFRSDTLVTQPTEINDMAAAKEATKRLFAAEQ